MHREQYDRSSRSPLVACRWRVADERGARQIRGAYCLAVGRVPNRPRRPAHSGRRSRDRIQSDDSLAGAISRRTMLATSVSALERYQRCVPCGPARIGVDGSGAWDGARGHTGGAGLPLARAMGSQHLIGLAGAIRSPSGDVRGGFVRAALARGELAAFNALQRTMLWRSRSEVLALVFAFVQARQIGRPVRLLAIGRGAAAEGDYSVDIPVQSRDEIGILANAFRGWAPT